MSQSAVAVPESSTLEEDLAQIRRVALRNRVLQVLFALPVLYMAGFVALTFALPPVGDGGGWVFLLMMAVQLLLMIDVGGLLLFGAYHLFTNPRVSPIGKIGWVLATWLVGFPLLIYYASYVFTETGSDLDDPIGY